MGDFDLIHGQNMLSIYNTSLKPFADSLKPILEI